MSETWTQDRRAALRARDDVENLGRLTTAVLYVAVALLLGVMFAATFAGCSTSGAAKRQAAKEAATAVADVRDWPTLTDADRFEAAWRYMRFALDQDLALNGKEIPAEFAALVEKARAALKARPR